MSVNKSVKAFNQISSVSNAKYFMEDIAERIDKLCDALDEALTDKRYVKPALTPAEKVMKAIRSGNCVWNDLKRSTHLREDDLGLAISELLESKKIGTRQARYERVYYLREA